MVVVRNELGGASQVWTASAADTDPLPLPQIRPAIDDCVEWDAV